ncbi:MAG TPA: TIGR03960 family B12-binding radical SAM protein [Nitrospirota bacterium]|nr:TIGR03960 family B12-binding radical SAM protein [Nitrospirota bacterium]
MYEDFLPLISKPSRYINNEINAVHKDLSRIKTKVCLFFPDAYEIGMSHIGLRILYDILNSRTDTACERVFSPWLDYETRLRASGRTLRSLESNLPLSEFDIIGVTLQYELSYSNILAGLELAGIPLHRKNRFEGHPVVMAGGPCAVNPGPLSEFIDVFFIGEAEEDLHTIIELRQQHPGRAEYLEALSQRSGFYVPSLGGKSVRRRFIKDLESASYPNKPLVPLMKPIHDRVTVEVARGCIRGCRFCQAGIIYRPYRERSPGRVKDLLGESIRCTGYDELSLAALSSGDYSGIQTLMRDLVDTYRDDRISLSLPSLRIGTLTPDMIRTVADVRKTGFTLAPEAGTERLRRVINKPVTDGDLMSAARTIFANGWNVLKLYFMIGLPTETEEDLDGIIRLTLDLLTLGKTATKRHVQINITVSTFVPKPHTPFQWFGQATREMIEAKQAYLAKGLRMKGIVLKPHNPETSLIEGAFARGDSSVGRVIEEAVRLGCRFDGWSECFDFKKWEQAFRACSMDPAAYACRKFDQDEPLSWDFIHTGVTKKFLQQEYRRAVEETVTENCRVQCEACGIGCLEGGTPQLGMPTKTIQKIQQMAYTGSAGSAGRVHPAEVKPRHRIRVKFSKTGRLRFLSHLDLMNLFQRAAARASVPIAFSHGFNPHPKIAFGPAISVGMESTSEYLDMETSAFINLLETTKALNSTLPDGLRILESRMIPSKTPSLSGSISRYRYEIDVPATSVDNLQDRLVSFLSRTSVIVSREGKQKDIRPCIESAIVKLADNPREVEITLIDHHQVKPRVQDVVAQLFSLEAEQATLIRIRRTGMFYRDGSAWRDPMDVT